MAEPSPAHSQFTQVRVCGDLQRVEKRHLSAKSACWREHGGRGRSCSRSALVVPGTASMGCASMFKAVLDYDPYNFVVYLSVLYFLHVQSLGVERALRILQYI